MSTSSNPNELLVDYAVDGSTATTTIQSQDDFIPSDSQSVTAYKCNYHVESGTITQDNGIAVSSYYDLLYPCDQDPTTYTRTIAETVLTHVAEFFELLPDGTTCTIPDTCLP